MTKKPFEGTTSSPNINLRMNLSTHKRLKLVCNLLDMKMIDVVSTAIDEYLKHIDCDDLYQQRIEEIYNS
jgi:hypothetical protein